ncbi:MAG: hypothetical protein HLUCCA08_11440 [Rhodobacteraceae bacterium HLUCCA08]|nr:MAG: hypothetical protein HLUCCA08_11440 [Rhodobacteraceae bacterium HLUCCA08]
MKYPSILALVLLAACGDGNPFTTPDDDGGTDQSGPDESALPPGTEEPASNRSIFRYEERNDQGGGYAEDIAYDSATDTFTVDNLAFDGENTYDRGAAVASLGPNDAYAVYDADVVVPDFVDGDPVGQIVPYRAIVGLSTNPAPGAGSDPRTTFAIVRTGGYVNYGFGGFVYERNGGVVLPRSGQALFEGDYAGMRVFDGRGGMELTEGDMTIEIDFVDPNDARGVKGRVINRQAFEIDGTPVALGNDTDAGELPLPDIRFVLDGENGNLNDAGEAAGEVFSTYVDVDGNLIDHENGSYYAILAGDTTDAADGGEIVGIMVLESDDRRFDGVTAQETGGFILYR